MPTYTSLWRHWQRTCWCLQLWHASSQEDMYKDLPTPERSGWLKQSDGSYAIDWEDKHVQGEIQSTIDYLIRGCACKTGCRTKRCKCNKKGNYCGPGCECQGCSNMSLTGHEQPELPSSDEEMDDAASNFSSTSSEQTWTKLLCTIDLTLKTLRKKECRDLYFVTIDLVH